jgi:hypothetical protein
MKTAKSVLGLLFILVDPAWSKALELKPETLKAWEDYIQLAGSRMEARLEKGHSFLWADELPGGTRRLRQGDILVSPMAGHGTQSVPNGLIHHWIGAAFLPRATVENVLTTVHDYDRYREFYKPIVVESKFLGCIGATTQNFSMIWRRKVLFVTDAVAVQYELQDFSVDERRWYQVAGTTRVQEIEDYGGPTEHELPPGRGNGFIWLVHGISRFEQRDGGVYIELEAMALTREMPASMRWLLSPIITRLSRNSLFTSLQQTRDAVSLAGHTGATAAACATTQPSGIPVPVGGN